MELKQFRAVVTVAECGSVTKAAQVLHMVQPALSRQIASLEDELGAPLFERTRHGMQTTEAGATFVVRARRILQDVEKARVEAQPSHDSVTGIVTVGLLDSVDRLLAGQLIEVVHRNHPGIELHLATAYSGHLQRWLDDGDLDISLLYNLRTNQSVRVVPLLEDELWAVAPASAGLSPDRPVDLRHLLEQPFIMPIAGQHGIRVLLDEARVELEAPLNVVAHANSMALQTILAEAGHGWTILPAAGIGSYLEAGRLSSAPIRNPRIVRSIALGLRRTGQTPPAVQVVAKELVALVRRTARSGRWVSAHANKPPVGEEAVR